MSTNPKSMATHLKPIILVDGSSYLYRAFHALPALTNSKGFPTGAVYGLINMLKKLISDYQPNYIGVIFDAKGKTFRDDIYPAYKAQRKEMPNDLYRQVDPINQIIEALGLPIIAVEGVEADDVIGTLAERAKSQQIDILVSTSDKDLAQLVNDKVTLINTMSNTVLNPDGVVQKFGVRADQMIDYLTLVGDTSDNIPGVPLVGPKTAAKWLSKYQDLDTIIANADQIGGKVGENLRASLSQLPMTKSLVTVKLDVDLPFDFDDLQIKAPNKKALLMLYRDMEFKSWLSEILEESKKRCLPGEQKLSNHFRRKSIDQLA